jgi:hypothetical protein
MAHILDVLGRGVSHDPFNAIGPALKGVTTHGTLEFGFSLYQGEDGVWNLTAFEEGAAGEVRYDLVQEKSVPTYNDAREVIQIHTHPLAYAYHLAITWSEARGEKPSVAFDQLELMRSGVLDPIPMPPSNIDLRGCAERNAEFEPEGVASSCAVAAPEGVWRIDIEGENSDKPLKLFAHNRLYDEYQRHHVNLFTTYSDAAVEGVLSGDRSQYEEERAGMEARVASMLSIASEAGFEVTLERYEDPEMLVVDNSRDSAQ